MKTALKILAALAAVVGAVYVVATYGDKIVAWARNLLASCPCRCGGNCCDAAEADFADEAPIADAPEAPVEEVPAEEAPVEAAPVEEPVIAENEPVADETDFAD